MVGENPKKVRNRKWHEIVRFLILAGIVIFLNVLASQFFFRLDLTEDKRYSIAPATKKLLSNLDDVVFVEVYLEGEFPAGFKRLQSAIKEKLDEFRIYSGQNIQYKFTNPSANPDQKARNEFYLQLAKKGLQPTNLNAVEGDKRVEKIIFPGAIVSFRGKEIPVLLLKGNQAASPEQRLNQSVEGVEYELASAIRKLTVKDQKKIAFLEGHGELNVLEVSDMMNALSEYYDVDRVDLTQRNSLDGYDAIVLARPTQRFGEPDKFKIDQFIVKGGKALFLIDQMQVNLDSIGEKGTFSFPYNTNLDDLFFRFGFRVNADLIQDMNSGYIPMVVGIVGDKPQTQMMPWRYFPLINNFSKSPITKNLDAIYTKFVSTIDTVKAPGIQKVPLMYTSRYSRVLPAPVRLNFNEARLEVNPRLFNKENIPVAYLLEGSFRSLYKNRLAPEKQQQVGFVETGKPGKIVVVSDGDLIRNEVNKKTNTPYELGYDRFAGVKFANKEFALNAMDYMLDESGLISVRTKEIVLRPLDRLQLKEERTRWQLINIVLPLVALVLYGLTRFYLRKRKYEKSV
ncbi:gliding motility-associated ABC transporter substrate-binding protein GldG [Adhaeribacter soli]|uniref:Gliding motility-associated ABC transporter substrate-binding protein GldG n=1 Tax=Adhaeribacter soli TaxID=2607655 RepID=A0A5N1J729_9BACT|nr:gliding motility-associated ABC transporter substrate-binding protein GldG [Adhaeribacter soli]KAA9345772.1 gliding motility-associated ABC transporter substrate-binding protein GldG [Adhaeribacter soli]